MKKGITAIILALALCVALLPVSAMAYDMGKAGYSGTFSFGYYHGALVEEDGRLCTWGSNEFGQLGLGNYTNKITPTNVPGLSNVTAVSLGWNHNAAITADGSLYTWGANEYGQLGVGDEKGKNVPTKVTGLSGVVAVSLGGTHSAAITNDGSFYTWGYNEFEQLGLGDNVDRNVPAKVPGLLDVIAVSLGHRHSAAITSDGSLYIWGSNAYNQLGIGGYADSNKPVKVPGLSNVVAVSLGYIHSAAITSDGSLYTWGSNGMGQLGLGDNANRDKPTKVTGLSGVVAVSLGDGHTAALTADGALYMWGYNHFGQLGLGDNTDRNKPAKVTIPSIFDVVAIGTGDYHTAAITSNGVLYTWGCNDSYQLGLGDSTDRNTPQYMVSGVKLPTGGSLFHFYPKNIYAPGQFADVNENDWYGYNQQKVVSLAFQYGLMKGTGADKFNPAGNVTIAEAITVAARIHSIYTFGIENFTQGDPWYKVYVDYAVKNGIIKATDFPNYNAAATRAQMAYIFAHALPPEALQQYNIVNSLPDVNSGTPYNSSIVLLYEAGVVSGSDAKGTFKPGSYITRAEAAAIISRMILPNMRTSGVAYG